MRNKVFGVGLNKTGTTTLGSCFQILGYKHQGHSLELFKEYDKEGLNSNLKHVIDKNETFEDWPWPLMWRELVKLYPEAKFILTKRIDSGMWYKSQCKHIKRYPITKEVNLPIYGSDNPAKERDKFVSYYENFNTEIEDYFNKNCPEKLLVVCWERGDEWTKICNFLNLPIPNTSFPHANSSKYPMEFKYFYMNKNELAIKALFKSFLLNPLKGMKYYRDLFWIIRNVVIKNPANRPKPNRLT